MFLYRYIIGWSWSAKKSPVSSVSGRVASSDTKIFAYYFTTTAMSWLANVLGPTCSNCRFKVLHWISQEEEEDEHSTNSEATVRRDHQQGLYPQLQCPVLVWAEFTFYYSISAGATFAFWMARSPKSRKLKSRRPKSRRPKSRRLKSRRP